MHVSKWMTPNPTTVAANDTLETAMKHMSELGVRHLPVVDRKSLIGIVSERDILEAIGWDPQRAFDAEAGSPKVVRDFMSVGIESVAPTDTLVAASECMLERRIGSVAVLENKELVGVLTEWDLLRACVKNLEGNSAGNLLIHDIMAVRPVTIEISLTAKDALDICVRDRVHHLAVNSDGWFVGLVSDRDLLLAHGRGESERKSAGEVMTTTMVTIDATKTLLAAAKLMTALKIGALPVVEPGPRLTGLVTASDVLQQCLRDTDD